MSAAQIFGRLVLVVSMIAGCSKLPSKTAAKTPPAMAPVEIGGEVAPTTPLSQLASNYRSPSGYQEQVVMTLSYAFENGRRESEVTRFDMAFLPPNQIKLGIESADNHLLIVSDGRKISARIQDPVTNDFDNQVVLRVVPTELSLQDLFAVTELFDPAAPEEMISVLFGAPASLDMTSLGVAMGEGMLHEIISNPQSHEDRGEVELSSALGPVPCRLFEVDTPGGKYRCWTSTESGLLRRIEFPEARQNLAPGLNGIDLVADFESTTLSASAVQFSVPKDGQQVKHFVLPPIELATQRLGKKIESIELETMDGQRTIVAGHPERISVLVWFQNHGASQVVLQQLEQLRSQTNFRQVDFGAVAAGEAPKELREWFRRWRVSLPCYVDPAAIGRDRLGVVSAPTIVIIDGGGTLQYVAVGANPRAAEDVEFVLGQLLDGHNVAAEMAAQYEEARRIYDRQLAVAKADQDGAKP